MKKLNAIALAAALFTSPLASAMDMGAMSHANPLPNYMRVVKMHGDQLNLSEDQAAKLKAWREQSGPLVHGLVGELMAKEKALFDASMNGAPKAQIMTEMALILDMRRQIAAKKTDCRDNMQRILSAEQFDKVKAIYKGMMK